MNSMKEVAKNEQKIDKYVNKDDWVEEAVNN